MTRPQTTQLAGLKIPLTIGQGSGDAIFIRPIATVVPQVVKDTITSISKIPSSRSSMLIINSTNYKIPTSHSSRQ